MCSALRGRSGCRACLSQIRPGSPAGQPPCAPTCRELWAELSCPPGRELPGTRGGGGGGGGSALKPSPPPSPQGLLTLKTTCWTGPSETLHVKATQATGRVLSVSDLMLAGNGEDPVWASMLPTWPPKSSPEEAAMPTSSTQVPQPPSAGKRRKGPSPQGSGPIPGERENGLRGLQTPPPRAAQPG